MAPAWLLVPTVRSYSTEKDTELTTPHSIYDRLLRDGMTIDKDTVEQAGTDGPCQNSIKASISDRAGDDRPIAAQGQWRVAVHSRWMVSCCA
jgi:hypothetical protein